MNYFYRLEKDGFRIMSIKAKELGPVQTDKQTQNHGQLLKNPNEQACRSSNHSSSKGESYNIKEDFFNEIPDSIVRQVFSLTIQ